METGNVFQHFGKTQFFKIYDISEGKVISSKVIDNGGFGHHDLVGYLKSLGVEVLILGNRGQGAVDAMNQAGLKNIPGVTGSADKAAEAFASGTLVGNPGAMCNHHGEHHASHDGEHHDHSEGSESGSQAGNAPKFHLVKS